MFTQIRLQADGRVVRRMATRIVRPLHLERADRTGRPKRAGEWVEFQLCGEFELPRRSNARIVKHPTRGKGARLYIPGRGYFADCWDCWGKRPIKNSDRAW